MGSFHDARLGFLIIRGLKTEASPRYVSLIVFDVCGILELFFLVGWAFFFASRRSINGCHDDTNETHQLATFFFGLCGHGDGELDFLFSLLHGIPKHVFFGRWDCRGCKAGWVEQY